MKRTISRVLAAMAAAALCGGLVYAVLVAAHLSDAAAATVYGLTPRRVWATAAAGLALVSIVAGALALRRPTEGEGAGNQRGTTATVALAAGLIAVVNGGLNLAMATGGPGTGNGVVGGAAALVLGLIGMSLGGIALGTHVTAFTR
jgi:peptidoglycan/LPS O-acetylase OafA/YrhL